jgi:hypothetical protein
LGGCHTPNIIERKGGGVNDVVFAVFYSIGTLLRFFLIIVTFKQVNYIMHDYLLRTAQAWLPIKVQGY